MLEDVDTDGASQQQVLYSHVKKYTLAQCKHMHEVVWMHYAACLKVNVT